MTAKIESIRVDEFFNSAEQEVKQLVRELQKQSHRPEEERVITKLFPVKMLSKLSGYSEKQILRKVKSGDLECLRYIETNKVSGFTQNEFLHNLKKLNALPSRPKDSKPATIAVSQYKGGTGKTTTTTNLGAYLAMCGYKVLVIDLDPQGSATEQLWKASPDILDMLSHEDTIYQAIAPKSSEQKSLEELALDTAWTNLKLVPATLAIDFTNMELSAQQTSGKVFDLMDAVKANPKIVADNPNVQDCLDNMSDTYSERSEKFFWENIKLKIDEAAGVFDVVIIDCSPNINPLNLNAVYAADVLLMPVMASMLDVSSLYQYLAHMKEQFKGLIQSYESDKIPRITPRLLISNYDGMLLEEKFPNDSPVNILESMTSEKKGIATKDPLVRTFMQLFLDEYLVEKPIVRSDAVKEAANAFKTVFEIDLASIDESSKKKHTVTMKTLNRSLESFERLGEEIREILNLK